MKAYLQWMRKPTTAVHGFHGTISYYISTSTNLLLPSVSLSLGNSNHSLPFIPRLASFPYCHHLCMGMCSQIYLDVDTLVHGRVYPSVPQPLSLSQPLSFTYFICNTILFNHLNSIIMKNNGPGQEQWKWGKRKCMEISMLKLLFFLHNYTFEWLLFGWLASPSAAIHFGPSIASLKHLTVVRWHDHGFSILVFTRPLCNANLVGTQQHHHRPPRNAPSAFHYCQYSFFFAPLLLYWHLVSVLGTMDRVGVGRCWPHKQVFNIG